MAWKVGPNGEGAWADLNHNGVVDSGDEAKFKAAYLSRPGMPNWNPEADFNGDGQVNALDFSKFAQLFATGRDPVTGVQLERVVESRGRGLLVPALVVGGVVVLAALGSKK